MPLKQKTILDNLNLAPDWVEQLNQNPIPYIIKHGNPAEVFLLLKNVYELTYTHALYRLVESAAFKQKALHKIANKNYHTESNKNLDSELLFYLQLQKVHQ